MKKYIFIIALIFLGFASDAQTFVQGGITKSLLEQTSLGDHNVKSGLGFDLQIGKFVTNKKMRALKISFRPGRTEVINDKSVLVYNPVTTGYDYFNAKQNLTSSVFSIGYERKKCFANTEFDDPWQYYNIISYQFSFVSVTDKLADPSAKLKLPDYTDHSGSHISLLDISVGLGMARKLSMKTYLYAEARFFGPALDETTYSGAGLGFNFGIRQFIR